MSTELTPEDLFHHEVHTLYFRIMCESSQISTAPMSAITWPTEGTRLIEFDNAMRMVERRINTALGHRFVSMRYEGGRRWSIMGTTSCDWLQFELMDARTFMITKELRGRCALKCRFRGGGLDVMAQDIQNAIKILANRNAK